MVKPTQYALLRYELIQIFDFDEDVYGTEPHQVRSRWYPAVLHRGKNDIALGVDR